MQPGLFSDTRQEGTKSSLGWMQDDSLPLLGVGFFFLFFCQEAFKGWIQSFEKKKDEQKEMMHQRLTAFGKKRHEEGTVEGRNTKKRCTAVQNDSRPTVGGMNTV